MGGQLGPSPGFVNLRWAKPVFAGDTVSYRVAVTGKRGWATLPDVGGIEEVYPGYSVLLWHGIFAPKNTPPAIIRRFNNELAAVVDTAVRAVRNHLPPAPELGSPGAPRRDRCTSACVAVPSLYRTGARTR